MIFLYLLLWRHRLHTSCGSNWRNDSSVKGKEVEVFILDALWSRNDTLIAAACRVRFLRISFFACALGYGVHVLQRAKHRNVNHKRWMQQVVCSCGIFTCQQKTDWGQAVLMVYLKVNGSFYDTPGFRKRLKSRHISRYYPPKPKSSGQSSRGFYVMFTPLTYIVFNRQHIIS